MASIFPGYEAYSLRIDTTTQFPPEVIDRYTAVMPPEYYFFGHEIGDHTQKPHYQGIVWYKQKLTQKQIVLVRNNLKNYCHDKLCQPEGNKKWQPVSFKIARKNTLASYCTKEGAARTTNLTDDQMSQIPKWKSEEEFKQELSDKLDSLVVKSIKTYNITSYSEFVGMYADKYFDVYGKYSTIRNNYFKAARKYDIISTATFLQLIGVISPNCTYQELEKANIEYYEENTILYDEVNKLKSNH